MSTAKKASWTDRLSAKIRSRSKSPAASPQSSFSSQSRAQSAAEPPDQLHQPNFQQIPGGKAPATTKAPNIQSQSPGPSIPIAPDRSSLWTRGYAQKKTDNPELIQAYELLITAEAGISPLDDYTGMQRLIEQQLQKVEDRQWKLQIGSQPIVIREQVGRLVRAIMFAKDFITPVLSSEPHASLAWAGVCLFLPLLCRPEEQDQAMIAGLDSANSVMYRFIVYERLYMEGDPKAPNSLLQPDIAQLKDHFEKAAVRLIADIVELQARVACQCSRNSAFRYLRDVFQSDDWSKLSKDIADSDSTCMKCIDALYADMFDRRMKEQTGLLNAMSDSINTIVGLQEETLKEVRSGFTRIEQITLDGQQQKILNALWTSSYENHLRLVPNRVPNTCKWFLDNQRYCTFKDNKSSDVLWLSADPGCGKSVISRTLIEEDLLRADRVVCYFFFRAGNPEQGTLTKALAALAHQIVVSRRHLINHVEKLYERKGEAFAGSVTDLWALLIDLAADKSAGEVVCVIDALDECETSDCGDLIGKVTSLYKSSITIGSDNCRLKFLLTSRPYRDINRRFQTLLSDFPSIKLSADTETPAITAEIDLVIDYRMKEICVANDLTEITSKAISDKLKSMKGRTYLWLKLILDVIDSSWEASKDRLESLIESLPSTIYESYQRILSERRGSDLQKAKRIFQIMLVAKRPLRVSEMSTIMALDDNSCRKAETVSDADHVFREKVRYVCGLLVIVEHNEIYFMHQTVREFLLASKKELLVSKAMVELSLPLTIEESQLTMFLACSRVILFEAALRLTNQFYLPGDVAYTEDYHTHGPDDDPSMDGEKHARVVTLSEFTLLQYAASFWSFHASEYEFFVVESGLSLSDGNREAFETRCEEICSLIWVWWPLTAYANVAIGPHGPLKWPQVIVMAVFGFVGGLERYLSRNSDTNVVNATDYRGRTALSWTAATGNRTVTEVLVSHGANVNMKDNDGKSSLYYAASQSSCSHDMSLIEYLVECGANDHNALYAAIEQSRTAAEFLLAKGFTLPNDTGECHYLLERCQRFESPSLYLDVVTQLLDRSPLFRFTIPEIALVMAFGKREMSDRMKVTSDVSDGQWIAAWRDMIEKWDPDRQGQRNPFHERKDDLFYGEDPGRIYPHKLLRVADDDHDFGEYLAVWHPCIEPLLADSPTTPKLAYIMDVMLESSWEDTLDAPVVEGMTLPCMAARFGNIQLLRSLVSQGWSAVVQDDHGHDAISYAADRAHLDCMDLASCNASRGFHLRSSEAVGEHGPETYECSDLLGYSSPQIGSKRRSLITQDDLEVLPQGLRVYGKLRCSAKRRWIIEDEKSKFNHPTVETRVDPTQSVKESIVDTGTARNTTRNALLVEDEPEQMGALSPSIQLHEPD